MAKKKKKIGRNDPCPCGSGKKYKKCCMEKDQQRQHEKFQQQEASRKLAEQNWNPFARKPDLEDVELFENDPAAIPADDFWGEYEEDWDEDLGDERDWEAEEELENQPPVWEKRWEAPEIKTIPNPRADISEEDHPRIESWWDGFEALTEPDEARRYFETLFTEEPDLARKVDWPDAMFELGDRYRKQGRHTEYIDFLMRIRRDWPQLYLSDFGYFDRDIITYLLISDRQDEIPEFLSLFREYPSHDPDNLFAIIRYLTLTNCQDILIAFVRDICHEVCYTPDILNGAKILKPVVMSYWAPYLRPDVSEAELAELAEQMQAIKGPLNQSYFKPEFLKEQIDYIVGEFTAWDIADCDTIKEVYTRYYHICQNFMGFLHREKGKGWLQADFLRDLIYEYFERVIPEGKRPREAFGMFTDNKIDRTITQLGKDMLFIYPSRLFGALNAVYYFGEYLGATESVSGERAQEIQDCCTKLFTTVYPNMLKGYPSVKAFEHFPL